MFKLHKLTLILKFDNQAIEKPYVFTTSPKMIFRRSLNKEIFIFLLMHYCF